MKEKNKNYEVEMLVRLYQNERQEATLQAIMDKCKNVVYSLAGKYHTTIPGTEVEDLVSEGNIVLWDAVQTWDEKRGCSFISYLYACLCRNYNTLYNFSNREKRNAQGFIRSYEQINSNSEYDEEGNTFGNILFSVECEDYSMVEVRLLLDTLNLSEQEKIVANLLVAGMDKPDIARILKIKTPSVHSYVKRIGKKLIQSGMCA
jgi:RNA polymerase sigma factor (sigma-70 family)